MFAKRSTTLLNLPTPVRFFTCTQCRALHKLNAPQLRVPKPTPFVPDVPTFLTLIGRGLSQHASKIPSWEALFTYSSQQLRDAGFEPPRARRYLLWWRERFRNGITGIGGDAVAVKDGIAELRIAEVPSKRSSHQQATLTKSAGMRKVVVNVTPTVSLPFDPAAAPAAPEEGEQPAARTGVLAPPMRMAEKEAKTIAGVKLHEGDRIGGTGVEFVKGHPGVAKLRVQQGLWEEKRGHKVDGGERRKAEVRYKRFAAEAKNKR